MAKSSMAKQTNDPSAGLSSYSDLFEEFFKSDAQPVDTAEFTSNDNTFGLAQNEIYNDQPANTFFQMPDPYALQQHQLMAYYYGPALPQQQHYMMPAPHQPMHYPSMATVCKPGFVRNRPQRKQTKPKTPQQQQQQQQQLPAQQHVHFAPIQPVQQAQPISLPIFPGKQASSPKQSQPSSPTSNRSAGTSDFVKQKLQQKIRARMIQKGQIPPNPTEDELRRCGVPPSPTSPHFSMKSSPKPADLAAYVASTVTTQAPQPMPMPQLDAYFQDNWQPMPVPMQTRNERDPLVHFDLASNQNSKVNADSTVSYDDFFSDFIQY